MKQLLPLTALVTALGISPAVEANSPPRLVVRTATVATGERLTPTTVGGEVEFGYQGYYEDSEEQGVRTKYAGNLSFEGERWSGQVGAGAEVTERYNQSSSSSFTLEASLRRVGEDNAIRFGAGYGSSAEAVIHDQPDGEVRADLYGRLGRNFGAEIDGNLNINLDNGELGGRGKATLLYEFKVENIELRVAGSGAVERNQYHNTTRVGVGLEAGVNVGDVFNFVAGFLALPNEVNGFREYYGQIRLFEGSRVSIASEAAVNLQDDRKEVRAGASLRVRFN